MPLWNFLDCCAIPEAHTEGMRLADDVLSVVSQGARACMSVVGYRLGDRQSHWMSLLLFARARATVFCRPDCQVLCFTATSHTVKVQTEVAQGGSGVSACTQSSCNDTRQLTLEMANAHEDMHSALSVPMMLKHEQCIASSLHHLGLKEDNRIRVFDCRQQEPFGICWASCHHYFDPCTTCTVCTDCRVT